MERITGLKIESKRFTALHVAFLSLMVITPKAFANDSSWQTLGRFIQTATLELPRTLESPRMDSMHINTPLDRQDCSDLFAVSCMPGDFDDGTAVMHTPSLDESSGITYLGKIFERARTHLQVAAVWDPIIQKKENLPFVEKVVEFAKLSENQHCATGKLQTKNCLSLVKHALVKVSEELVLEQARHFYKTEEVLDEDERPPESIAFSEPYGSLVNFARDVTQENSGLFVKGHKRWLEIVPQTALPLMKRRIEDIETRIFPELSSLVQDIIHEKVNNPLLEDPIKLRMASVHYKGDILCNSKHALVGLLDSNIRIGKGPNGDPYIRTCGLFLDRNPSEYALVFHLARKIASVIDPCAITGKIPGTDRGGVWSIPNPGLTESEADENFPIGNGLLSCLRSPESAYARSTGLTLPPLPTPTPTAVPSIDKTPIPKPERPLPPRTALHCLKSDQDLFDDDGYVRPKDDQMNEAFTDWVATEALAKWVEIARYKDLKSLLSDRTRVRNGYSNVFRSFCRVGIDKPTFRVTTLKYPALDRRINGVLAAHPRVREQMGCPIFQGHRSCSGVKPKDWQGNPFKFDGENESLAPKPAY